MSRVLVVRLSVSGFRVEFSGFRISDFRIGLYKESRLGVWVLRSKGSGFKKLV